MMWWYGPYGGMGWGWAVGGIIFMILFWGAIIALVVWGIRRLTERPHHAATPTPTPLDIAKERYARGEINKEQYEEMTRILRS